MPTAQPPGDDFARRIGQALAHGLAGNMTAAADEIQALVAIGVADTYATICALAHTAVAPYVDAMPEGQFFGLLAEQHGQPASIDDAPPAIRFAMRFMVAQANHDWQTSVALFKAGMTSEPQALADAIAILLDAAIAAERALLTPEEGGRADPPGKP